MQRKIKIMSKRHILFTIEEHNIKHKDADFNLQKAKYHTEQGGENCWNSNYHLAIEIRL